MEDILKLIISYTTEDIEEYPTTCDLYGHVDFTGLVTYTEHIRLFLERTCSLGMSLGPVDQRCGR